jgi:hypothetical protein
MYISEAVSASDHFRFEITVLEWTNPCTFYEKTWGHSEGPFLLEEEKHRKISVGHHSNS